MVHMKEILISDYSQSLVNKHGFEGQTYSFLNLPNGDFMVFEWEDFESESVIHIYLSATDIVMEDSVVFKRGDFNALPLYETIRDMVSVGCMGSISLVAA